VAAKTDTAKVASVFSAPWTSRAAAIGLLVLVLLVIYAIVIGPLIQAFSDVNRALADGGEQLARYQQIALQRPDMEAKFAEIAARQAESGIVENNSAQVRSVQILPTMADGDFRRVGVRIQMTGSIGALARILHAFEAGETFLFVDNLDISNRMARRTRNSADRSDPELLIRLDLQGYVRPEVSG
jgi:hypothetical protein